MIMTSLPIAPPETGGHPPADNAGNEEAAQRDFPTTSSARVHCLEENAARATEVNRPYLRKKEKIKLSTMLTRMQVTIGK